MHLVRIAVLIAVVLPASVGWAEGKPCTNDGSCGASKSPCFENFCDSSMHCASRYADRDGDGYTPTKCRNELGQVLPDQHDYDLTTEDTRLTGDCNDWKDQIHPNGLLLTDAGYPNGCDDDSVQHACKPDLGICTGHEECRSDCTWSECVGVTYPSCPFQGMSCSANQTLPDPPNIDFSQAPRMQTAWVAYATAFGDTFGSTYGADTELTLRLGVVHCAALDSLAVLSPTCGAPEGRSTLPAGSDFKLTLGDLKSQPVLKWKTSACWFLVPPEAYKTVTDCVLTISSVNWRTVEPVKPFCPGPPCEGKACCCDIGHHGPSSPPTAGLLLLALIVVARTRRVR